MRLEYYFDFTCPFAYLGSIEVESLARRSGAELVWRPMFLGGVLRALGADAALAAEAAARRAYSQVDRARWAELRGLPLAAPRAQRSIRALRVILAVEEARWPALIHELYRSCWERGEDVEETEILTRALAAAGVSGADAERALAAAESPAVKEELRRRTDEALARGVFGAPTMFVHTDDGREHMFWGQDRLEMAAAVLAGWTPPSDARQDDRGGRPADAPPIAAAVLPGRPHEQPPSGEQAVIEFWYDFISPFSYLASTQVEAVAARAGARVEWRPMLLVGVFRAVGAPEAGILAMSEPKRRYMLREIERWAAAWQVPLRWTPHFPFKTVTALRVALLAGDRIGELSRALFRAAWVDEVDFDDARALAAVCDRVGLDGAGLLARASEPSVKQQLVDQTAEAVRRGVFGAPTFLVTRAGDTRLFWGQDRLGLVERAAAGVSPPRS